MESSPEVYQQSMTTLPTPPDLALVGLETSQTDDLQAHEDWFEFDTLEFLDAEALMWTPEEYEPNISPSGKKIVKGQSKEKKHTGTKGALAAEDAEIAKKKRQQQNRMAQRSFRQRKQEAFEEVTKQLKAERRITAALRGDIAQLKTEIRALREEKNRGLEMAMRIRGEVLELEKTLGGWFSPPCDGPPRYDLH